MKKIIIGFILILCSINLFSQDFGNYWVSRKNAIYEYTQNQLICRYIPDEIYEQYADWQDRVRLKDIVKEDDNRYTCYQFLNYADNPVWAEGIIEIEDDKYLLSYNYNGLWHTSEFKRYELNSIEKVYVYRNERLKNYLEEMSSEVFNSIIDEYGRTIPMILSDKMYDDLILENIDKVKNINQVDSDGWSLLMYSIYNDKKVLIKKLLEMDVDLNVASIDDLMMTPLKIAIYFNRDLEIIELLLEKGANPELKTEDGMDAITLSKIMNDEEVLNLLINGGEG